MKKLIDECSYAMMNEMVRAQKNKGEFFTSRHQASACIREELEETEDEIRSTREMFEVYWSKVKKDNFETVKDLEFIRIGAIHAAAEAIQLAGTAQKAINSLTTDPEKSNAILLKTCCIDERNQ